MLRLNLWSMPRCASTVTMYAFKQRADTAVFDEPFYAAYLAANPALHRPYREELLRTGETDKDKVVEDVILGNEEAVAEKSVRFYKHIASMNLHNEFGPESYFARTDHMFLIRHPYRVVSSYYKTHGEVTVWDTGLPAMVELFENLKVNLGYDALVIDNTSLLNSPRETLSRICNHFDLQFQEQMLTWEKGGIEEDGIWADYWYKNTHKTSGFLDEAKAPSARPGNGNGNGNENDDNNVEKILEDLPVEVRKEANLCLELYKKMEQHI